MGEFQGFPKGGAAFFAELAKKQDREWFKANKARYEELWEEPMKALLAELDVRARLPGAFSYDHATHGFRIARGRGVPTADLLPAAFATSWLVNARTSSPVFKAWLDGPRREAWGALIDATSVGPHGWRALGEQDREAVFAIVSGLSSQETRIAAISKVLACLSPETVPLMDDHALVTALGPVVSEPTDADHPVADALHFVPMMDWFTRATTEHETVLVELARAHRPVTLDAAQVLDRLLWFDSWGWRLTHRMGRFALLACHRRRPRGGRRRLRDRSRGHSHRTDRSREARRELVPRRGATRARGSALRDQIIVRNTAARSR